MYPPLVPLNTVSRADTVPEDDDGLAFRLVGRFLQRICRFTKRVGMSNLRQARGSCKQSNQDTLAGFPGGKADRAALEKLVKIHESHSC